MKIGNLFQNNKWGSPSLRSNAYGLFNWDSFSINLWEDPKIGESILPKSPFLNLQDLSDLKRKLDLTNERDIKLIRAILANAHENNHLQYAVGTPIGLTIYALLLTRTSVLRELIRQICKKKEEIYIPLQAWLNETEDFTLRLEKSAYWYSQYWDRFSALLTVLLSEIPPGIEFDEVSNVIKNSFIGLRFEQESNKQFSPQTPDYYSTNRIFEAIATLDEMIVLYLTGYSDEESKLIIGERDGATYFSLINFLFLNYNFDPWTARLVLTFSLMTPLEPCYFEKSSFENVWESLFPAWRVIKIANAVKKIGIFDFKSLENDKIEEYLNKISDVLGWPPILSLFNIGLNTDFRQYYQKSKNRQYKVLIETRNPIFEYILDLHKLSCTISKKSLAFRFFGILTTNIIDLQRKILPPFLIYKKEVRRPRWLEPEVVDTMFNFYLLSVAMDEMLGSDCFKYTKKICEIWFNDKATAKRFLDFVFEKHFKKPMVNFHPLPT